MKIEHVLNYSSEKVFQACMDVTGTIPGASHYFTIPEISSLHFSSVLFPGDADTMRGATSQRVYYYINVYSLENNQTQIVFLSGVTSISFRNGIENEGLCVHGTALFMSMLLNRLRNMSQPPQAQG